MTAAKQAAAPVRLGCASCVDGWLAYRPSDGHPMPCFRCRPHLRPYVARRQQTEERWSERPEDRHDRVMRQRIADQGPER